MGRGSKGNEAGGCRYDMADSSCSASKGIGEEFRRDYESHRIILELFKVLEGSRAYLICSRMNLGA
jgi:hypothetical protein